MTDMKNDVKETQLYVHVMDDHSFHIVHLCVTSCFVHLHILKGRVIILLQLKGFTKQTGR